MRTLSLKDELDPSMLLGKDINDIVKSSAAA